MPSGIGNGRIAVMYGAEGKAMALALLDAAGVGAMLPKGGRVALKPNLVVARPAAEGATTHPEILAALIEYCLDYGAGAVDILESSWLGEDTARAFAACGIDDLATRYGITLHDLKKDSTVTRDTPAGKIRVCRRVAEAEFLVNVPVLKGHCQTRLTCALKNMKGCIPDAEKRRFHQEDLHGCIAALAVAIRPHLTLVDGICGDVDFEEGGNPVQANRLLLGTDPVRIDAYGCRLMGIPVEEVGYIGLAEQYGVGVAGVTDEEVWHVNRPAPDAGQRYSGKARLYIRHIRAEGACSACYAAAVHALKRLDEEGKAPGSLPPIHMGQGWRGKAFDGLGVGRCCQGASRHVAGCPPHAADVVETLRGI